MTHVAGGSRRESSRLLALQGNMLGGELDQCAPIVRRDSEKTCGCVRLGSDCRVSLAINNLHVFDLLLSSKNKGLVCSSHSFQTFNPQKKQNTDDSVLKPSDCLCITPLLSNPQPVF